MGKGKSSEPENDFFRRDALSTITRFKDDLDELEHLDFTTMALPYHVRRPKKVLVVGAGGGTDVLLALKEKASSITALEPMLKWLNS